MADLLTAKALREQRATLATRMREMADKANTENRDFNAEEKPNWEKVNADYDTLSRRIEIAERIEHVSADQGSQRAENLPGREDRDGRRQLGDRDGEREAVTEEHRATRSRRGAGRRWTWTSTSGRRKSASASA